jgi:trans-aconitate 2-methyltransferase
MLAAAAKTDDSVQWNLGDAADWTPAEKFDIVFSNAMLQWLPDHSSVVPRLFAAVAPGGALAVQLPAHLHSPLHQEILAVANEPAWREATRDARGAIGTYDASFYYDLLCGVAERIDLWETEYSHVMNGPVDIITWIRATGLRPFLNALKSDDERQQFESLLRARVTESYPSRRDGRVLFPFRRLFFIAYRADG